MSRDRSFSEIVFLFVLKCFALAAALPGVYCIGWGVGCEVNDSVQ